jgi:hypothetical protein
MPVDPLNTHGPAAGGRPKVDANRPARQTELTPEQRQGETAPSSGDSVEVSAASRELVDQAEGSRVPAGTLEPARMQEVLRRLAEGFYDSAEVRADVARRARQDIGLSRPE